MKNCTLHIIILFTGILFWSCANRLGLEGGLRDQQAPVMNWEDSDQNFIRNFDQDEFQLAFNEFVKVDNPNEQIVISPPLNYGLTPVSRGKKIIFRFHPDEVLLENTTYTIQFGEAIQDITESNPIQNLRYVFSTGNIIDSMQVRVMVRDLQDKSKVPDALVMLYETLSDTVIRKGRPTYFSKTDSSGLAVVENCRPGQYRIFALIDENRNYQFDLPEEKVGHIDTFINSTLDSSLVHNIFLYSEIDPPIQLATSRIDSQIIAITIGGASEYLTWRSIDSSALKSYWNRDTLFISSNPGLNSIILESEYSKPDTLSLHKIKPNANSGSRFKNLQILKQEAKIINNNMSLRLTMDNPILSIDQTKVFLFNHAGEIIKDPNLSMRIDSQFIDILHVSWNHKNKRDSFFFEPGAISTWLTESDSIIKPIRPQQAESLSNLLVDVTDLNEDTQYILELYSTSDELLQSTTIRGQSTFNWKAPGLFPKKHKLVLITDLNRNGRRDGGWFDRRQLPEPVISSEINNLRPDWDVQTTIKPR